ncbi:MAG: thioredoxin family protein [Thermoplasmataceae archaeon]
MFSEIQLPELKDIIRTGETFVLDIKAEWCHPCRLMEKYIIPLSNEYPSVNFYSIDYDRDTSVFDFLEIGTVPYIIFFKNGRIERRVRGYIREDTFRGILKEAFP